jgi:alanyl-tRNA synthetase
MVRASEPELVEHVEKMLANERTMAKQLDQLKEKLAQAKVKGLQPRMVGSVYVIVARVPDVDREQMRSMADSLRNQYKSAVVVLATSSADGTVPIVAGVTKDLTSKVQAGKLVSAVAQATGGKGGGRPDMAEGGGKDAAALDGALDAVYREIESKL